MADAPARCTIVLDAGNKSSKEEDGGCTVKGSACKETARRHAAVVRVVGKGMRLFIPRAKQVLAACLLASNPGEGEEAEEEEVEEEKGQQRRTVTVEAVVSGLVLVPALQLDRDSTIGALRAAVAQACGIPAQTVRLFAGHGGVELELDTGALDIVDGAVVVVAKDLPTVMCCVCGRPADDDFGDCTYVCVCVCV